MIDLQDLTKYYGSVMLSSSSGSLEYRYSSMQMQNNCPGSSRCLFEVFTMEEYFAALKDTIIIPWTMA